jgi:hypothetical protein
MNISAAEKQKIVNSVEGWLRECVLGLSLCPYARVPFERGAVRIAVTVADDLATTLDEEIKRLQDSAGSVETTLVIIAQGLQHFLDFNDCTGDIEQMLQQSGLDDEFQLAAFHPAYLFAGEAADDASHYTNRAPYPVVQLLRVESVSKAVQQGDTLAVPERNMETLRALDRSRLQMLFPWVK